MATRKKQKRISKAWVATPMGPRLNKVAIQPLGEWCVTVAHDTGAYVVTHLPTGMAGYSSSSLDRAGAVLGVWARCEHFTLATWTTTLAKRFQRARDKALRA